MDEPLSQEKIDKLMKNLYATDASEDGQGAIEDKPSVKKPSAEEEVSGIKGEGEPSQKSAGAGGEKEKAGGVEDSGSKKEGKGIDEEKNGATETDKEEGQSLELEGSALEALDEVDEVIEEEQVELPKKLKQLRREVNLARQKAVNFEVEYDKYQVLRHRFLGRFFSGKDKRAKKAEIAEEYRKAKENYKEKQEEYLSRVLANAGSNVGHSKVDRGYEKYKKIAGELLFENFVVKEQEKFNRDKIEALPEKDRGRCLALLGKVAEKYSKTPKAGRWALSATVGTGVAYGAGSVAGVAVVGYAAFRFSRAALGSLTAVAVKGLGDGLEKFLLAGEGARKSKIKKSLAREADFLSTYDDLMNLYWDKLQRQNKELAKLTKSKRNWRIGKALATVVAGGAAVFGAGAFDELWAGEKPVGAPPFDTPRAGGGNAPASEVIETPQSKSSAETPASGGNDLDESAVPKAGELQGPPLPLEEPSAEEEVSSIKGEGEPSQKSAGVGAEEEKAGGVENSGSKKEGEGIDEEKNGATETNKEEGSEVSEGEEKIIGEEKVKKGGSPLKGAKQIYINNAEKLGYKPEMGDVKKWAEIASARHIVGQYIDNHPSEYQELIGKIGAPPEDPIEMNKWLSKVPKKDFNEILNQKAPNLIYAGDMIKVTENGDINVYGSDGELRLGRIGGGNAPAPEVIETPQSKSSAETPASGGNDLGESAVPEAGELQGPPLPLEEGKVYGPPLPPEPEGLVKPETEVPNKPQVKTPAEVEAPKGELVKGFGEVRPEDVARAEQIVADFSELKKEIGKLGLEGITLEEGYDAHDIGADGELVGPMGRIVMVTDDGEIIGVIEGHGGDSGYHSEILKRNLYLRDGELMTGGRGISPFYEIKDNDIGRHIRFFQDIGKEKIMDAHNFNQTLDLIADSAVDFADKIKTDPVIDYEQGKVTIEFKDSSIEPVEINLKGGDGQYLNQEQIKDQIRAQATK